LTSALKNHSVTSSPDGQPIASLSTAGGLDLNFTTSPTPPRNVKITAGLYGLVHPSYLSGKRETSLTKSEDNIGAKSIDARKTEIVRKKNPKPQEQQPKNSPHKRPQMIAG
ncbi:unnamed protein product, partial [Porites lobata]